MLAQDAARTTAAVTANMGAAVRRREGESPAGPIHPFVAREEAQLRHSRLEQRRAEEPLAFEPPEHARTAQVERREGAVG